MDGKSTKSHCASSSSLSLATMIRNLITGTSNAVDQILSVTAEALCLIK